VALVTIGQNYVSEAERVSVSYRTNSFLDSSTPSSFGSQ
jgi:hypothetical protein